MRYWEIDFLRGIGIVLMLISNFITDLQFFLGYPSNVFWRIFAYLTASIFVFVSGLSFYVSYSKRKSLRRIFIRFVKLMALGILITIVTFVFLKEGTIYFGILHFLGLAWVLAVPFYRFGLYNALLALVFIVGYPFIDSIHAKTLLLLPIGITPDDFYTLDYFPIFPWFGIFLLGLSFGFVFRHRDNSPIRFPYSLICFLGRNSLKIYLIHQPIFVGLLFLIFGKLQNLNLNF